MGTLCKVWFIQGSGLFRVWFRKISLYIGVNVIIFIKVYHFILATHSWMKIKLEPCPIPRAGHQAICLPYNHENEEQDEVLIFGGGNNDGNFFHDLLSANIPFNPVEDFTVLKDSVLNNV